MAMDLDGAFRGEVLQSRLAKWEPFAELIENDEFREKFINRSADLMNSTLSLENGLEVTDALAAEIAGEVAAVLDDSRFAEVFGSGSLAEVPLVGVVGGPVPSGDDNHVVRAARR